MLNTPFSPWPSFTQEEVDAVSQVLLSNKVNYWTGQEGRKFEKEFADWVGCDYAVALGNGTLALDIALKALNIGNGDEVVTTPRTFLASASSIVTAGATPVFADVDLNSQNITAENIEAVLTEKTKAVIVVHLAGMPAEMDEIMALSDKYGFKVIEDCAQAHGAKYKGRSVGTIGHIGAWSFCQDKIMTTGGEGGMVTTNSEYLWKKMWSYKDHGKSYEAVYHRKHPPGFRWLHETIGTNWRMTEMQAAIGRVQLRRLDEWSRTRRATAKMLDGMLYTHEVARVIEIPQYIEHAQYKYYFFINSSKLKNGWSRDKIIQEIEARNVPAYQGSCSEVYLEKAFDEVPGCRDISLPNAKALGQESVMLLVHPTLTRTEIQMMLDVVAYVLELATKDN